MRYCPISTFINKILTQKYKATKFFEKNSSKTYDPKAKEQRVPVRFLYQVRLLPRQEARSLGS